MFLPDQVAQAVHDAPSREVYGAALVLGLGQFLTWFSGRHRGNKGKKESKDAFKRIEDSLASVQTQVRDLSSHVIGPDGENGIRGDVRELKTAVNGILERERDGPRVSPRTRTRP